MNKCQEARDKLKKMNCTSYVSSIVNRSIAANPVRSSHQRAVSRDNRDTMSSLDAKDSIVGVPVDLSCFFFCGLQLMRCHLLKALDACRLSYVEWVGLLYLGNPEV